MSEEINTKNFRYICGLNGLTPSSLPKKIRRHRDTMYRALRNPGQFKPTYKRILTALPIREVPNEKQTTPTTR